MALSILLLTVIISAFFSLPTYTHKMEGARFVRGGSRVVPSSYLNLRKYAACATFNVDLFVGVVGLDSAVKGDLDGMKAFLKYLVNDLAGTASATGFHFNMVTSFGSAANTDLNYVTTTSIPSASTAAIEAQIDTIAAADDHKPSLGNVVKELKKKLITNPVRVFDKSTDYPLLLLLVNGGVAVNTDLADMGAIIAEIKAVEGLSNLFVYVVGNSANAADESVHANAIKGLLSCSEADYNNCGNYLAKEFNSELNWALKGTVLDQACATTSTVAPVVPTKKADKNQQKKDANKKDANKKDANKKDANKQNAKKTTTSHSNPILSHSKTGLLVLAAFTLLLLI